MKKGIPKARPTHIEYEEEEDNSENEVQQKLIEQQEIIDQMQKSFITALDSLQKRFDEYVKESSQIQDEMLDRIEQLKAELKEAKAESSYANAPKKATQSKFIPQSTLYSTGSKYPRKLAQNNRDSYQRVNSSRK